MKIKFLCEASKVERSGTVQPTETQADRGENADDELTRKASNNTLVNGSLTEGTTTHHTINLIISPTKPPTRISSL